MRQDWENVTIVLVIVIMAIVYGLFISNNQESIKQLEQRIAVIEDSTKDVLDTRMWVSKRHFAKLQSEVARHSSYWTQKDLWKATDLQEYRDYWFIWRWEPPTIEVRYDTITIYKYKDEE